MVPDDDSSDEDDDGKSDSDSLGLADDLGDIKIEIDDNKGPKNDDDDFFDEDDGQLPKQSSARKPLEEAKKSESEQVVSLPKLGVMQLSKEMIDFKKRMTHTIEEQKKKNQLGGEVIAERPDESDEDESNQLVASKAADKQEPIGYRKKFSKITQFCEESTKEHK